MKMVDYSDNIIALMNARVNEFNWLFINEVRKESERATPKKTGDLRSNITTTQEDKTGYIRWDMSYAKEQEQGFSDKTGISYKNYTTPGTGPWFAYDAVNKVVDDRDRLWEQANQNIS